jgi:hypothetical protein
MPVVLAGAGLLSALGLVAGADPADAATAGLQDDRIAIAPLDEIPARADLVEASGARVSRVDLYWSEVARTRPAHPTDPADPAYDFSRWDAIARELRARGIAPIFTIYSTPAWAGGGHTAPAGRLVSPWAPSPGAFAAFVEAVARRYSGHAHDAAGRALPEVRRIELWNEPNLRGFLRVGGAVAPVSRYEAMARQGYRAAKRGNPRAIVIVGALGPRGSTGAGGIGALGYMKALLGRRVPMSAFSQHLYPAATPLRPTRAVPSWSTIGLFTQALRDVHPRVPFYVTETGYTTAATSFHRVHVSARVQAQALRQIFSLPVVRREIALVVWYQLQDNPEWPSGLRDERGRPKPAWAAFRAVAATSAPRARFTLSASQLRINQRIGQAAIRRLHRVEAALAGRPAPASAPRRSGGTVRLSAGQLLINQRIFQAAIRRAARLEARLEGRPAPRSGPGEGGTVRLSVRQLIVNQRIAQAAVRRSNALLERVEAR